MKNSVLNYCLIFLNGIIPSKKNAFKKLSWLFVLNFLLINLASAQDIQPEALRQMQALINEKNSRTPAQKKIDSQILYAKRMHEGKPVAEGVATLLVDIKIDGQGRIKVELQGLVSQTLIAELKKQGCEIIFSSEKFGSILAMMPISRVENIASLEAVKHISPFIDPVLNGSGPNNSNTNSSDPTMSRTGNLPAGNKNNQNSLDERLDRIKNQITNAFVPVGGPMLINSGSVVSEADVTHKAALARTTFSTTGLGVKIGVLSNGVDGFAASQASGDLPTPIHILPGQAGAGAEGRAMMELIHDLAPGAELYYATATINQASFAQNILDLRTAGCDIIVDDVGYFAEAVFQDDIIAQAINSVTASGALYFSSAGNSGNKSDGTAGAWEGDFLDAGPPTNTVGTVVLAGGTVHDFGGGVTNNLIITSNATAPSIKWSDPLGGSGNDYDFFILNNALTGVAASSTNVQDGDDNPIEIISVIAPPGFRFVIFKKTGDAVRALHLNTNRGKLSISTPGVMYGHNAAASAYSVAATPAQGNAFGISVAGPFPGVFTTANVVEPFSSDGRRRMFFNPNGSEITVGNVLFGTNGGINLQKPDITAADGTVTATPGFGTFYGTSAAAPHAAAIAGLIKSRLPALTPAQIRTALISSALDIETPGFDRDAGNGIIMAYEALAAGGATTCAVPMNAVGNQEFCAGTPSTAINFTGAPVGTVYYWSNDNTNIGLAAAGTGNIPSFPATNATLAPILATITVTPVLDGCEGVSITFTITVYKGPTSAVLSSTITTLINEGFDDITPLPSDWSLQNLSSPIGTITWFQGNPAVFVANSGATNSYIGVNFNSGAGTSTLSNWLIAPNITLTNGDVLKFYTRTTTSNLFPDRLEVRMSANGASTDVGATSTSVGDFTTVLLSVNPTLVVGGYPEVWTQFTIPISGLGAPTSGRIAFRYFVTSGGPAGANSNYIGLDDVVYSTGVDPAVICPGSSANLKTVITNGVSPYTVVLSNGASTFTVNNYVSGTNISVSPTTTTTYTLTSVSDFNNCPGTGLSGAPVITVNSSTVDPVPNQVVCVNEPTAAINFTSPTPGGTIVFNWTNNTPSIGLAAAGSGNIPSFNALNGGAIPITATITVTPSYTNLGVTCNGTPLNFTITVNSVVSISCPPAASEVSCQTQAAINTKYAAWLSSVIISGGLNTALSTNSTGAPDACGGTKTVVFTVTSSCGPIFSSTCSSSFTVQAAPHGVLTCPGNASEKSCQTQADINTKFTAWLNSASAGGGCTVTNNNTGAPSVVTGGAKSVVFTSLCSTPSTCVATFKLVAPIVISTSQTNVTCNGGTNGSANATVSGGVAPYQFSWSPGGSTSSNRTSLPAGPHTLTVTDAQGCSKQVIVTIIAPPVIANFFTSTGPVGGPYTDISNVSGGTGTYAYLWTPGGQTTASASGHIVGGTYSLKVTDGKGCIKTFQVLHSVRLANPDAVANTENDLGIKIYPNPSSGFVTIDFPALENQQYKFEVYDLISRKIYSGEGNSLEGINSINYDFGNLYTGIYFIKVDVAEKSGVFKIVLER